MSRFLYQGTTKDATGKVITEATISVYLAGGYTAASVYIAMVGGVAVNSVISGSETSPSPGYFNFWVDTVDYSLDQRFRIVISKSGFNPQLYDYISIFVGSGTGSGDMEKVVYDPNADGVIALAQLDTLVCSESEADSKVSTHAALTTGTHGVGAGTVAKVGDIAVDANLSAAAQDAVTKRHAQSHPITSTSDHTPTGLMASQLLRLNVGATAIESSGKVITDFEAANANIQTHVTGTGSPHTAAGVGAEGSGAVAAHAALTTGTHGVGVSTVASVANIATHAALTASHGVTTIDGVTERNAAISAHAGALSHATIDSYLNQAVKTTSNTTFANITLTGFSGFIKAIAGVLSTAALTDADIPDTITLSNITQITNRSHTSLTDIGSITHTTIDSYLNQAVKTTSSPTFANITTHANLTGANLHVPQVHGSTYHTGTIGTWAQIDKTTSSIADITTKSHTSLSDIGTLSHATIDSYLNQAVKTTSTPTLASLTITGGSLLRSDGYISLNNAKALIGKYGAGEYLLIMMNAGGDVEIGTSCPGAITLGYGSTQNDPIFIRVGAVNSKKIEVGATGSGGTGYRMLRVLD